MKRLIPALTIAAALTLTGCSSTQQDTTTEPADPADHEAAGTPFTSVFDQSLPDGRTATCVWARGYKSGGLSCDWENAK